MRSSIVAASVATAQGAHWAVLVAGSNGYGNYRHQADVCHSYQVAIAKGVPASNIITMAYDDIASNSRNPFPGQMFNQPSAAGVAGVDVYAGCNIDYKVDDVNQANFEAVMTGTASGKKLESTSEDNVFVFFSDHGGTGLICFPGYAEMHKDDFQAVFDTMHSKGMYKKLVFYLETCESGSMFQGLSTPGVYALSAASPYESSWGTYCGSDAMVNGKNIGSCLGDLFSVAWMEDSDATDITQETLDEQFTIIHTRNNKAETTPWGDMTFKTDKVAEFQGDLDVSSSKASKKASDSAISARQLELKQAYHNYIAASTSVERLEAGKELQMILDDQLKAETAYVSFLELMYPDNHDHQHKMKTADSAPNQKDCELAARKSFKDHGDFDASSAYAMQFHKYVVNVCADMVGVNVDVAEVAKQACKKNAVMV